MTDGHRESVPDRTYNFVLLLRTSKEYHMTRILPREYKNTMHGLRTILWNIKNQNKRCYGLDVPNVQQQLQGTDFYQRSRSTLHLPDQWNKPLFTEVQYNTPYIRPKILDILKQYEPEQDEIETKNDYFHLPGYVYTEEEECTKERISLPLIENKHFDNIQEVEDLSKFQKLGDNSGRRHASSSEDQLTESTVIDMREETKSSKSGKKKGGWKKRFRQILGFFCPCIKKRK